MYSKGIIPKELFQGKYSMKILKIFPEKLMLSI